MGSVTPNVLASPNLEPRQVTATLERVGGTHQVLVTRGAAADGVLTMSDEEIARRCAPTQELSTRYAEIVEWFEPVAAALDPAGTPSPEHCWTLRLLLIATFRRVALADPQLPDRLLPEQWQGTRARELVASLYTRLRPSADSWLAEVCSNPVTAWPRRSGEDQRFR